MSSTEPEIAVDDPTAPAEDSPAIAATHTIETIVYIALLGLAALLAFDNWRTGMGWEAEGPQAGYFPFYLSVVLAAASLYGLIGIFFSRAAAGETFVTRDQFRRVMQVFIPTFLFCLFTQWLGLYVASLILIAGFMWMVGRIALWKSIVTSLVFSLAMFVTFEIAFDVIMPKGPLEALFGF